MTWPGWGGKRAIQWRLSHLVIVASGFRWNFHIVQSCKLFVRQIGHMHGSPIQASKTPSDKHPNDGRFGSGSFLDPQTISLRYPAFRIDASVSSAFSTCLGSFVIARISAFAGPVGSRLPCSQFRSVD